MDRSLLTLQEAHARREALFAAYGSGDVDFLDAIAALGPYGDAGWVRIAREFAEGVRERRVLEAFPELRESPHAGTVLS